MAIRNFSKRPAWVAQRMDDLVKKRTGVTRHQHQVTICGLKVQCFTDAPEIVRERWFKKPRGRNYHFAIMRFKFTDSNGQNWTALRGQVHDANHGYGLSITGFYNLTPA